MDVVTIRSSTPLSLGDIKEMLDGRLPTKDQTDPVVVEDGNSRVYIRHTEKTSTEKNPRELILDYNSLQLVKKVIVLIGDDAELIIENDFGISLPGDQFVSWIESDPNLIWSVGMNIKSAPDTKAKE